MYKCNHCERSFEKKESLRKHYGRIHKICSEDFYIEYDYNGVAPTCACGCKEKVTFKNGIFNTYILGHHARVDNNFLKDPETLKRSHETRNRRMRSGEIQIWNKGLTKDDHEGLAKLSEAMKKENNPDRAKNISEALTGIPHDKERTEKQRKSLKKYWADPKRRAEQREKRINYLKNFLVRKNTGLEKKFKSLLKDNKISYEFQFIVSNYCYDFKVEGKNILIETDGDFYHCNPVKHPVPLYETQKKTVEHDKVKNKVALDNGYHLIRYWESDINERPEWVIQDLKRQISLYD